VGIDDCLRFAVGNAMPKGLGCVTLCHASMGHLSVCVCVCVRACISVLCMHDQYLRILPGHYPVRPAYIVALLSAPYTSCGSHNKPVMER